MMWWHLTTYLGYPTCEKENKETLYKYYAIQNVYLKLEKWLIMF